MLLKQIVREVAYSMKIADYNLAHFYDDDCSNIIQNCEIIFPLIASLYVDVK